MNVPLQSFYNLNRQHTNTTFFLNFETSDYWLHMVFPISYIIRNNARSWFPIYSHFRRDFKTPVFPCKHFSPQQESVYLDTLHLHHLTKLCRTRLNQHYVKLKQQVLSIKKLVIWRTMSYPDWLETYAAFVLQLNRARPLEMRDVDLGGFRGV